MFLVEWNTECDDDTLGNYVWFVWVHKDELSWIIVPAAFQWLKREFILVFVLGEQLSST